MRNQKVAAEPVKVRDPVNKLRKDAPQIQPGVKAKGPGKQFQVDSGKTALRNMFARIQRKGV